MSVAAKEPYKQGHAPSVEEEARRQADEIIEGRGEELLAAKVKAGSLEERMQARSEELEHLTTEVFDVPRWEGMLAVELKALGWKRLVDVVGKNAQIRDTSSQLLYSSADQLLAATVGFYEVEEGDDGRRETSVPDATWNTLACNAGASDELTPRQALIYVVGDVQTPALATEWATWAASARPRISAEVTRDFVKIGPRS
jgi:hypothetical protein